MAIRCPSLRSRRSSYFPGYTVFNGEAIRDEYLPESECSSQDIYEVERLIERKMIKGVPHYLVLWKGYPKEDSTWVAAYDITETAIRFYHEPDPPVRAILDSVSSLSVAIKNSLCVGVTRKRTFALEFPRHVFNYLFKRKGTVIKNHPGRVYQRTDFPSDYFDDSHFQYYNQHSEGCFVKFPIYMYSHVKFSRQTYDKDSKPLKRNFTEKLYLKIVKTLQ